MLQLLREKIAQQPDPSSLAVDLSPSREVYEARDAALVPLVALKDLEL